MAMSMGWSMAAGSSAISNGASKTHVHRASAKESASKTHWDDTVTHWPCGVPVPNGIQPIPRNYFQHLLITQMVRKIPY